MLLFGLQRGVVYQGDDFAFEVGAGNCRIYVFRSGNIFTYTNFQLEAFSIFQFIYRVYNGWGGSPVPVRLVYLPGKPGSIAMNIQDVPCCSILFHHVRRVFFLMPESKNLRNRRFPFKFCKLGKKTPFLRIFLGIQLCPCISAPTTS